MTRAQLYPAAVNAVANAMRRGKTVDEIAAESGASPASVRRLAQRDSETRWGNGRVTTLALWKIAGVR
jgi:predicted transcriptional regulator